MCILVSILFVFLHLTWSWATTTAGEGIDVSQIGGAALIVVCIGTCGLAVLTALVYVGVVDMREDGGEIVSDIEVDSPKVSRQLYPVRRGPPPNVARRTQQDDVARRTQQDDVARRIQQDDVARRTQQDEHFFSYTRSEKLLLSPESYARWSMDKNEVLHWQTLRCSGRTLSEACARSELVTSKILVSASAQDFTAVFRCLKSSEKTLALQWQAFKAKVPK